MADAGEITKAINVINDMSTRLKDASEKSETPSQQWQGQMHGWMNKANTTIAVANAGIAQAQNTGAANTAYYAQAKASYDTAVINYISLEKEVRYKLHLLALTGTSSSGVSNSHSINADEKSATAPPPSYMAAMGVQEPESEPVVVPVPVVQEVRIVEVPDNSCSRWWRLYLYASLIIFKIVVIIVIYNRSR